MSLEYAQGSSTSPTNQPTQSSHIQKDVPDLGSNIEAPPSSYTEIKGIPYAAAVLGYDEYTEVANQPALAKIDPTFNAIHAIDEYVIYTMRLNGLEDSQAAYNSVIEDLANSLGLSKYTDPKIRLAKLGKVAILKLKSESKKARYKAIKKQYGTTSTKSQGDNRVRTLKLT